MVNILGQRGMEPSLVATSSMVRCRQTAEILADNLFNRPEIIQRQELLPQGDLESLLLGPPVWRKIMRKLHGLAMPRGRPDNLRANWPANASIALQGSYCAVRFNAAIEFSAANCAGWQRPN